MKKVPFGGGWVAAMAGWGLLDADTRRPIDPVALVTDEKIEMSPWEIQDVAVQVVRDHLENKGFKLMSWHSDPEVFPSIWFVGKSKGPEWVVVRPAIFPADYAERPDNWQEIAASCANISTIGHFASVVLINFDALLSVDEIFDSESEEPVPLWRGCRFDVAFEGLE
ncbi:hypothetical protein Tchar_02221 [Tepidimonas charontis]|uniref:Uncharacterized protein n=2 Tax=Tepidimonas charontis TaxID=2267262 RepID=A0A554X7Y0_9BURK|nr:hypothetical protein Tchar_02221 [Tepidimonas charontis]